MIAFYPNGDAHQPGKKFLLFTQAIISKQGLKQRFLNQLARRLPIPAQDPAKSFEGLVTASVVVQEFLFYFSRQNWIYRLSKGIVSQRHQKVSWCQNLVILLKINSIVCFITVVLGIFG